MPELPEVETIRLGLQQGIVGQRITGVDILSPGSFSVASEQLKRYVLGQSVQGLQRRAKVLIINLSGGYSLMVHLKMTGQMIFDSAGNAPRFAGGHPTKSMVGELPDRSTRVVFNFKSGGQLFFNDQRKFGWIKLVPTAEVASDKLVARLGPEPLTELFERAGFAAVIKRRGRSPIKAVILDQTTVSGIGNIYADESLHLAKIHPARRAGSLTASEVRRLHQAIKSVIAKGIEHGGTSFTTYVNALGLKGNYLEHARVFRRQGQPCPNCGTPIEKLRVAGRGTHVCPKCQRP